jgi:uncharacterized protein YoaH (UPF0181 family)
MAKRKLASELRFEPLADLEREYAPQREAIQKRLIEDWTKNKPTKTRLQNAWFFLVENPDRIQDSRYSVFIYHGLRSLIEKLPQRRKPSQEDIFELVELCRFGGMSPGEARQFVAESLKQRKTVEAVARAHQRNKKRRDKSR